jgi:hypothetical protein
MKNKNKNPDDQTPIRDGDTRPDQNIEGKTKKPSSPLSSEKSPTTKERAADVNSLEDYKDAKS